MRFRKFDILVLLIAVSSVIGVPAFGQGVDPNLQVRIETALPPPDTKPHLPVTEQVSVRHTESYTTTQTVPLSIDERKQRLQKIMKNKGLLLPFDLSPESLEKQLDANGIPKTEKRVTKHTRVRTEIVEKPVPREVIVTASEQSQAAFDTNATKSNLARASDWVFNTSESLTVNIPVGVADSLVFQSGVADQRYAKLVSKDLELLANSATYIQVLNAVHGPNKLTSPGTTTVDAVSYSLASTTVFGSGFHPYQVELFTPSIAWARSNINLGGTVCGPKGQEVYCLAGNVAAEGEYTFSDIATQENASARLQGGMTWQTGVAGLTTTATGMIQGRYFTAFPGGRQDLILQAVARADYAVSPNVTLSGVLQVTQQFSTLRAAEWNGLMVFPVARLKITF